MSLCRVDVNLSRSGLLTFSYASYFVSQIGILIHWYMITCQINVKLISFDFNLNEKSLPKLIDLESTYIWLKKESILKTNPIFGGTLRAYLEDFETRLWNFITNNTIFTHRSPLFRTYYWFNVQVVARTAKEEKFGDNSSKGSIYTVTFDQNSFSDRIQ